MGEPSYPSDREYTVRVRPVALDDLDRIRAYVARDHPANALAYVARIIEAIESLNFMPGSWARVRSRRVPNLRQRLVGSHRVLFDIEESSCTVVVLRVAHTQQSLPSIVRALGRDL